MTPTITTFTGRHVNPLALRVEDISIVDLAHHLSCINRFVGALAEPVSVAQHSFFVAKLMKRHGLEALGLFHDASEAYLGDVTKWVKHSDTMKSYREAEADATKVINQALGLQPTQEDLHLLEEADRLMVRYEAYRFNPTSGMFSHPEYPRPDKFEIELVESITHFHSWNWRDAKDRFLYTAETLGYIP